MNNEVASPEQEGHALSLSDDESLMFQRILRSSHRNIASVEIKPEASPATVTITKPGCNPWTIDYAVALKMDDNAWQELFNESTTHG